MENNPSSKVDKPDLSKTADQLSRHTQDLKQNVTQVAQDIGEHASASVDYASAVTKEKVSDGFSVLNSYIQAKPLTSIAVAASFGFLLGWFKKA